MTATEQAIEATLGETPTPPPPTPPKQPPYDELIESLRRDWDIEASWDGLRRFWYVGLTDEGVRKRDEREATLGRGECEVEAENAKLQDENAKLRERIHKLEMEGSDHFYRTAYAEDANRTLEAENAKLRDLALNCYRMAKAHCTDKDCRTRCSHWPECCEHDSLQHAEPCELAVLACELGIEVG